MPYQCFSLDIDRVENGYSLLMERNALIKCLIVHIHTGLLVVSRLEVNTTSF